MPPKRKLVVLPQAMDDKKARLFTSKPAAKATPAGKVTPATKSKPASKPTSSILMPVAEPSLPSSPLSFTLSLSASSSIIANPNKRHDLGRDPLDEHQDDIVVNSVEDESPAELMGVEHYRHILIEKRGHKRIYTDSRKYRSHTKPVEEPEEQEDEVNLKENGYTHLPPHVLEYTNPIYIAKTTNPAVFLAISRIAQRNLLFLDLTSASNHLPNLSPAKPLPILKTGIFIDDIPHQHRISDVDVTIVFLPKFYAGEVHAVGFFTRRTSSARTCLFTPCSTCELEEFDMIDSTRFASRNTGGENSRNVKAVGSRNGKWLRSGVVEDWEEWSRCEKMVGKVWEERVLECRGV